MKHKHGIRNLPDFGMGVLDPEMESAVASHVDQCFDCQKWLGTREFLADVIGGEGESVDHPDTSLLALCVIRPEELFEPGLEELRRHLRRCSRCRQAVSLLTRATRAARPGSADGPVDSQPSLLRATGRRRMLAAAFAVTLIGAGVVLSVMIKPASLEPPKEVGQGFNPLSSEPAITARTVDRFSDEDLEGVQLIRNDRDLTVSDVTVKSGAAVTLQAGDVVVLGDGFRVAAGGRLTVSSGGSATPSSEPETEGVAMPRASGKGSA